MKLSSDDTRRCPRCRETKRLGGNFYPSKSAGCGGWGGYCIPCAKAKAVEWMRANPEKKRASDHKQTIKPENQRKMRKRLDRWAQDNPEKAKASQQECTRRYAELHPDRNRATQARFRKTAKGRAADKQYRQTPQYKAYHRDHQRLRRRLLKGIVSEANRSARRRGIAQVLTVPQWQEILEYFGHRCAYCNGQPERLEIDHIIPVTKGGQHTPDNVVPACRSCNARKGNRSLVRTLASTPPPSSPWLPWGNVGGMSRCKAPFSPQDTKRCPQCGETKRLGGNFYRSKHRGQRGWKTYCILCVKVQAVEWQKTDKGKASLRVSMQRYRKTDKGKASLRVMWGRYQKTAKCVVSDANNKARLRGASGVITVQDWQGLLELYGHCCAYCHTDPERLGMDHVIPISKGGQHTLDNVVPACWPCNKRKGARSLVQTLALDPTPILALAAVG